MKIRLLLIFILLFSFEFTTLAVVLEIDQDRLVESGHFKTDYLFAGDQLDFVGKTRDLFCFCEELNLTGDLSLGLYTFARTVEVKGKAGNGIRAIVQFIDIGGQVDGTSFIGAEEVIWGPTSHANGDSFIGARKVDLKGRMTGDLFIGAGEVFIDNEIRGDVQIRAGRLNISEKGRIIGDLQYYADQKLDEEERSRVTGDVKYVVDEEKFFKKGPQLRDDGMPIWVQLILKLVLGLVGFIILLLPVTKELEKQQELSGIISLSLWGLIPIFMYPTVIILSIVLIITLPFAVVMILAVIPLFLVTKTIGLTLVGGILLRRFSPNSSSRFLYYLIAVVLYTLLSTIPYFGILLMIFISSVGSGLALSWLTNKQLANQNTS